MVSLSGFKIPFILGLALFITYIVTSMLLGLVMPFIPLGVLGAFAGLIDMVITILAMGFIGGIVLKYIH